jgi:stress response protein YsnF
MANTVVGFFRERSEASDAVTQLRNAGFDQDDIDVSHSKAADSGTYETKDYESDNKHQHKGNAITRFFNSLFGDDSDDAKKYSDVSNRAGAIVTVHASGSERAEEAANILDASGAMDIDEGSLTDETYQKANRLSADRYGMSSDNSVSAGLTEADLAEAGVNPSDIADAETEAAKYSSNNTATSGGAAPGITGAPSTGNLTTANPSITDDYARQGSVENGDRNVYDENTREELQTSAGESNRLENDYREKTQDYDKSRDYDNTQDNRDNQKEKIDVVREDLQVGKKTVETGGVRVRSRIIEKPVEEHLRLREEYVRVQREPVNRTATKAELDTFQDREIELTEHAEVPVVNKEARVVEEVRVSKDVNERDETIRDTVRETQVDIDDDTNRRDRRSLVGSESNNRGNDRDYDERETNTGRS